MKFDKLIVTLIVIGILSCGFTAVFAEYGQLNDGTQFTVPDNYSIFTNENGTIGLITEDKQSTIAIMTRNPISAKEAKEAHSSNGYEFKSETTKNINGVEITEQIHKKNRLYFYDYFFKVNGKNIVVSLIDRSNNWNIEDSSNPINVIITSLTSSDNSNNEQTSNNNANFTWKEKLGMNK